MKRRVLYVATGNEYSGPGGANSDAVIAMDLESGTIMWASQVTPKDVYVVGCTAQRENCPDGDEGPDFDFDNVSAAWGLNHVRISTSATRRSCAIFLAGRA